MWARASVNMAAFWSFTYAIIGIQGLGIGTELQSCSFSHHAHSAQHWSCCVQIQRYLQLKGHTADKLAAAPATYNDDSMHICC